MFDIQGGKIKLSTQDLAIPPFKQHYNSAEDKSQALKEIEYIVWLYKWNSPYEAYPEKDRPSIIGKDVFNDEKYKPTADMKILAKVLGVSTDSQHQIATIITISCGRID